MVRSAALDPVGGQAIQAAGENPVNPLFRAIRTARGDRVDRAGFGKKSLNSRIAGRSVQIGQENCRRIERREQVKDAIELDSSLRVVRAGNVGDQHGDAFGTEVEFHQEHVPAAPAVAARQGNPLPRRNRKTAQQSVAEPADAEPSGFGRSEKVVLEASEPGELIGLIPRVAPDQAANLAEANDLEPVEALGHSACVAAAIGSPAPVDVENPNMQLRRQFASPPSFQIPPIRTRGHSPAAGQ